MSFKKKKLFLFNNIPEFSDSGRAQKTILDPQHVSKERQLPEMPGFTAVIHRVNAVLSYHYCASLSMGFHCFRLTGYELVYGYAHKAKCCCFFSVRNYDWIVFLFETQRVYILSGAGCSYYV